MNKLKRSNDRKVTNRVTANGEQSAIKNTFGLPSGIAYSCRGETPTCKRVCYAGKLEKLYTNVRALLLHNWLLLKDADYNTMVSLLDDMIQSFNKDCAKYPSVDKIFRIHWDGDFFSDEYTTAWATVIQRHPSIQFWVYTRVESSARILQGIDNLSLYYSTDRDNESIGISLRAIGIKLAYLEDTFETSGIRLKVITGKVGAMCPENKGVIPLISTLGSACGVCRLCVDNKTDIRFSISKG
jgi:hypothetical protein